MKIDIYNHVMPMAYLELMNRHSADSGMVKRISSVRLVLDIEGRVQMLERFPDAVLKRVSKPPIEYSRCSSAIPFSVDWRKRRAAASTFSGPTTSSLPATARSIRRAARCSSAKALGPSRTSISPLRSKKKSISRTPRAC